MTATVGAARKNETTGFITRYTGFKTIDIAASTNAIRNDAAKHHRVRSTENPTARQNPASPPSVKNSFITTSGDGSISGLFLTFATIAHIAITSANAMSG